MGQLRGIEKLDFDCKTATLTMKAGFSLSREAATQVLTKAGFGVTKIEAVEEPKVTARLFRVTGVDPARPETARQALLGALDGPELVAVDATGAAVVTLRSPEETSQAVLGASLRQAGFGLESFTVREWPNDPAVYAIELQDVADVAAATAARAALVALEKVLWAEVHPASQSAVILLNEPCSEIESKVRAGLTSSGFGVAQFRLERR